MKTACLRLIFLFLLFSCPNPSYYAQSKFIQPGAKWTYAFYSSLLGITYPTAITYTSDVVINGDSCQKLMTYMIYKSFNDCNRDYDTYIRQKGDTVFFKNVLTDGGWEILYNFSVPAGQSWVTKIKQTGGYIKTYIVTVDTVSTVVINGVSLKYLAVRFSGGPYGIEYARITERLGCSLFFFNYYNFACVSDDYDFKRFLCYSDNEIGTYQLNPAFPCNYTDKVGLEKMSEKNMTVTVYPNPASDRIHFDLFQNNESPKQLYFYTVLGEIIKQVEVSGNSEIQIQDLPNGIYTIRINQNNSEVSFVKLSVVR